MPPKPRKRLAPEQLRQDLAERRRTVDQVLERTSAVPSAMFGVQDPMVEARLLDDAALQLLRHLDADSTLMPAEPPAEAEADEGNAVSAADMQQLLAELAHDAPEPVPDLLEHLAEERFWILADITKHGAGVARQRATLELRDAMHDLSAWEGVNDLVLRELVSALGEASRRPDMPVLFRTLYLAASRALHRQGSGQ